MATETAVVAWEEYNERGRRLVAEGDPAGAEMAFTAAIAAAEEPGADPLQLASSLSNLAQLKYQQKAHLVAEDLFRRALAIREQTLGADDKSVITSINNLAALYVSRGALDDAEPLLKRATAASAKRVESSQGDLAVNLNNLARLYFKRGDYAQAEPLLLQLLTLKRPMGPEHPEVATVLGSLAKVRQALGKVDAAERIWRRVLAVRERTLPASDPAILQAQEGLADALVAQGKLAPAYDLRERVLDARSAALGADHTVVVSLRRKLDDLRMTMAAQTASTTIPIPPRRQSRDLARAASRPSLTEGAPIELAGLNGASDADSLEPTGEPTRLNGRPRSSRVSGMVEVMDRAPIEMLGDDESSMPVVAVAPRPAPKAAAPVSTDAVTAPAGPTIVPTPVTLDALPVVEWIESATTRPAPAARPSASISRPSAAVARKSAAVARKSAALVPPAEAASAASARAEPATDGQTAGRPRRPMQFGTLEALGRSRGKLVAIGIALLVICLLVIGVFVGPSLVSDSVPPPPGVHSIRRQAHATRSTDGSAGIPAPTATPAVAPTSAPVSAAVPAATSGDSVHAGAPAGTSAAAPPSPAASSASAAPRSIAAAFAAAAPAREGSHAVPRPVETPLPNRPLPPANTFAAHMGATPAPASPSTATPPAAVDDSLPPPPVVNVDVGKSP